MRINYDTYDMRREQDSINPSSHPDIMMLAPQNAAHPFYYARMISIFHLHARIDKPGHAQTPWNLLHVCHVRWFEVDTNALRPRRLTPLRWASLEEEAFGFVDPVDVLRACHLIPAEPYGRSDDPVSLFRAARRAEEDGEEGRDWNRHYVNQYVHF